ncbi:MAG: OmpP1/FadL family transporter [Deltaproteobacteria bacterium]|nr:OmpP1/FadL family transporter [Deltaproteobacteria bacterium]
MRGKRSFICAVAFLAALLCSGNVWAAGFQLFEQNASGIGNAYAGSAAVAENASTIFFNPAGMTKLQAQEISLGLTAVKPSIKFSNTGSTIPVPAAVYGPNTGTDGGDGGGWNLIPNAFLSSVLTKDLYVGLGISAPFGLATEYESSFWGRYQSIKFSVETLNVNPSLAYRVNDMISIGVGANLQNMKAEYISQTISGIQGTLKADDYAWGWNAGVLLQLAPATRLGVSYRSSVKHTLKGTLSTSSPLPTPPLPPGSNTAANAPATGDIELPDTAIVSFTQGLGSRWELLGDISWTRWSSVEAVNIYNVTIGATVKKLDTQFKDSWRAAFGANYKASEDWKFRFGLAFDQTPVPDAEHRMVSLPDSDRIAVATGVQYKPTKNSALDLGVEYLFMKATDINNSSAGLVKGDYSNNNALILGAQCSMSF